MYSLIPFEKYTNSMDHFYDNIPRFFMTAGDNQPSAFRTDIQDLGDRYLLEADLPGFRKEEISLDLKGDLLTVTACRKEENQEHQGKYLCRERYFVSYKRSFDVSEVQQSGITASYENGVLKLTLPKKSAVQPQCSKITIE